MTNIDYSLFDSIRYKKCGKSQWEDDNTNFVTEMYHYEGPNQAYQYRQLQYYIEWLMSLNSIKAFEFSKLLQEYYQKQNSLQQSEKYQLQNYNPGMKRFWLKKLNKKTKGFIDLHPINYRVRCGTLEDNTLKVVKQGSNGNYYDFLGYDKEYEVNST